MFSKNSCSIRLSFLSINFFLLLLIISPSQLYATHFEGGEKINIEKSEIGDCYLAANEINIQASIRGDLIAAGNEILVLDSIYQDIVLAGNKLKIIGYVGDDVRIFGAEINFDGHAVGDVIITGGKIKISKEAIIEGDLIISGADLEIAGTVSGQIIATGEEVHFFGNAGQNITYKGEKLRLDGIVKGTSHLQAENISLGENAKFHGRVEYWHQTGELDFGTSLENTEAHYNPGLEIDNFQDTWKYMGMGLWIFHLLSTALILALLIWSFNPIFSKAGHNLLKKPGNSLGFGFIYILGFPLLLIVLFLLVLGIPLGVFALVNFTFSLLFSQALSSLVFAHALNIQFDKDWNKGSIFLIALLSFILLKIISWIPVIGFIAPLILVAAALGALVELLFRAWNEYRQNNKPSI